MEDMEIERGGRQFFPTIFAILWLVLTFLTIPYFLAALNIHPSRFLLLDELLVDIHLGIHHGLIGYIALSIGILGMQYSTRLRRNQLRSYLFLISVFFLIKGSYLLFEDLIGEQIVHQSVEQKYIWDWQAPQVELFSLTAFVPILWMRNKTTLLALVAPVFLASVFFTPFAPITIAYLLLLLLYEEEERRSDPGADPEPSSWGIFKWTIAVLAVYLASSSVAVLVGQVGMNLW